MRNDGSPDLPRLAIAAAVLLSAGPANAQTFSAKGANAVKRCVNVMLQGPAYEGPNFLGEGFDCKPATLTVMPAEIRLTGRLSHRR